MVDERERSVAAGLAARSSAPLESHRMVEFGPDRDVVGLLDSQNADREPELVPVRHGRMLVSPFTFYRGAALPMAADLSTTPSSGLRVQLCGDAHLSNFGAFGSPERRLVFDLNDFDETLPGPFEWDVKRLAASMTVAGRENGFTAKERRKVVRATVSAYRRAMADFAIQPMLEVWYARLDIARTLKEFEASLSKKSVRRVRSQVAKAMTRDSTQALAKLSRMVDGERRIISDPPLIVPIEELAGEVDTDELYAFLRDLVARYSESLTPDRRHLLENFHLTRVARKVVGVGSVGTRAWILLMEPRDGLDPLLLQAKQANRSVLADYLGDSQYDQQGERVVEGQRLMQAVGDILLGWQRVSAPGNAPVDYYLRQLRDWKYAVDVSRLGPGKMAKYGTLCGWTLARAHARTGDRIAIAAYLGDTEEFDRALTGLAETYADQTERDHADLAAAAHSGRIEAVEA